MARDLSRAFLLPSPEPPMPPAARTSPAAMCQVLRRLRRAYGEKPFRRWGNGIDVLVETILSQNTSDANSSAAYRRLRRRFPTWQSVADAPVEQLEQAIRVAGLSRLKAPRIQTILRQLHADRGRITLEFLRRMPPPAAEACLRRFHGIGPKTVCCVLLFAFGMPLFPVDTHIHRIARRLRWIAPRLNAEAAHRLLQPLIAPEDRYEMHVLLIRHGRQTCKALSPRCSRCPLLDLCPYGRRRATTA